MTKLILLKSELVNGENHLHEAEKSLLRCLFRKYKKFGYVFFFSFLLFVTPAFGATASWYSSECCKYNPVPSCPTASGKSLYTLEAKQIDFAASWYYPIGTKLIVTNLDNGKSVIVTVLDRGPAKRLHREIDLSKSAFRKIADLKTGLISRVKVRVAPVPISKTGCEGKTAGSGVSRGVEL